MLLEVDCKVLASEILEAPVFHNSISPIKTVLGSQAIREDPQRGFWLR